MDIRLFGTTEVAVDGVPRPLGGPRQRGVLSDLALHAGRVVQMSQLIDDLWGDSPPYSAGHTVETYVSRLRRVLHIEGQPSLLVTGGSGYLLNVAPENVDALHFGELAARGRTALERGDALAAEDLLSDALALWRGAALADIQDSVFAPAAARRLENDRVAALESLMDARLLLGEHRELVSELERAIALDPYRERFHAQLMLALYRSGPPGGRTGGLSDRSYPVDRGPRHRSRTRAARARTGDPPPGTGAGRAKPGTATGSAPPVATPGR